jgi:hypothetical protein
LIQKDKQECENITKCLIQKEKQECEKKTKSLIQKEKEKIQNHLSYRFGKTVLSLKDNPFNFFILPFKLKKDYNDFKNFKKQ